MGDLSGLVVRFRSFLAGLKYRPQATFMPSPYHYSSPLPFHSEVWDPVIKPPASVTNQAQHREPPPLRETLSQEAQIFMSRLPPSVKLTATAARYPHILNKLATLWNDSKALDAFLINLLVDDRPNRVGFEFTALEELVEVRNTRLAQLKAFEKFSGR
jgi:hypothetical protein